MVEDDQLVSEMILRILEGDHELTSVEDGQEALELITSGKTFDVILCDLMMPRMTGDDLYAALAATHPELIERMIFVTGGAFTPEARAFLDTVRNPVLEKPFLPRNLRALVDGVKTSTPTR